MPQVSAPRVRLLLAPASAGKTAYLLEFVRAGGLAAAPRVIVPTALQARAWRRRLAEHGGALGVRVFTFDQIYRDCLEAAGRVYTELSEPVQYRLIRSVIDDLYVSPAPPPHYAPLAAMPGFVDVVRELIDELKGGQVWPENFAASAATENEPRLVELADIYGAYQRQLRAQDWADRPGLGWLAVETLVEHAPRVACDWRLVIVDGFDSFTAVQTALLKVLAARARELVITLNGTAGGEERSVHSRYHKTRQRLEKALGVQAQALPAGPARPGRTAPALAHLEAELFEGRAGRVAGGDAVQLVEAPDRAAEARAALRWLKARIVGDGLRPDEVALLARDIAAYRPFILQAAAEFGLPVHLADGLPLQANPAAGAVLNLLQLVRPDPRDPAQPALPRRAVVEAWRSPYYDWSALPARGAEESIGICAGDADALDAAARWGRVIGGLAQWEEALTALDREDLDRASTADEALPAPPALPATRACALHATFRRFITRITPPAGEHTYRDFISWLEGLIGPGLDETGRPVPGGDPLSLNVLARAGAGDPRTVESDFAALHCLKDILRGLVWAEAALPGGRPVTYTRFCDDLLGACEAATYVLPMSQGAEYILVTGAAQARGLPFRAVAVMGLAEGEFPTTLREDPFLRDRDRERLNRELNLSLELPTESAEREFFYEAITRPRERLLLTRPRLADNGAEWQPSPFWEEVLRLVDARPATLPGSGVARADEAASYEELLESAAAGGEADRALAWVRKHVPARWRAVETGAEVLTERAKRGGGVFDGDLGAARADLKRAYGSAHVWSPSRLEVYGTCPFFFFVGHALGLEPRTEPSEGLDPRQRGNLYHRILEKLYSSLPRTQRNNATRLQEQLPIIANPILDAAPEEEGFRATAWWRQTRDQMLECLSRTVAALAGMASGFVPVEFERSFTGCEVTAPGGEHFKLRGFVDRIDRAADGRLRIVDYKTAGPSAFTERELRAGKKLQLPLYALGVRDGLKLGEVVAGFYWHVDAAEPSRLTLQDFSGDAQEGLPGGPEGAMQLAADRAAAAIAGVRAGRFGPRPPEGGCPAYCPAASFCWHYAPGFGG